ncbi:hypothetical protein [Domibacillus sp. PGB-M46]|nr:hypothetical protein [Domibacillus sp. PGB-M46]
MFKFVTPEVIFGSGLAATDRGVVDAGWTEPVITGCQNAGLAAFF